MRPATATFPYIYREAIEVHWDEQRSCLYGPKPSNWSYIDWFIRIRHAAREQGVTLIIGPATSWSNIGGKLENSIRTAGIIDSG